MGSGVERTSNAKVHENLNLDHMSEYKNFTRKSIFILYHVKLVCTTRHVSLFWKAVSSFLNIPSNYRFVKSLRLSEQRELLITLNNFVVN